MFSKILKKIFGDQHEKEIKRIQPMVDEINEKYATLESLSDDDLKTRIKEIRKEIITELQPKEEEIDQLLSKYQQEFNENKKDQIGNEIDKKKEILKTDTQKLLTALLPEVYAIVKDTCRRLIGHKYLVRDNEVEWNMIPFDVQLIGAIVLHEGKIAEMATGEGKTLVATLPLFLNALTGRGVHLVTVNDYLAQRDSEWMYPVFEFHDLSVGVIINSMPNHERKQAYLCDITYGTNSEFGFDYLRDNGVTREEMLVQRKHFYSIVDEVDSVLIDEARTPLIISGPVAESKNFYKDLKPYIRKLFSSQSVLINRLLSESRAMAKSDEADFDELGKRLLLIKRGAPKNKAFMKLLKDSELKKLVNDVEGYYLRDKKMHELDDELFYAIEENSNSVELTEKGRDQMSKHDPHLFVLEQLDDILEEVEKDTTLNEKEKIKKRERETNRFLDKNEKLHNIKQLLKSYALFENDVDYVVQDNKVMIVDEFTGRLMPGRRFSDGLHQALEAKEGVKIEGATQTLATITLQNYFRMYDKLAGMTGTAITEEGEFNEIYNLPVNVIPTNKPISRHDHEDVIYLTKNDKYQAIIKEVEYWHKQGKPVLVGTITVDVSETLSRLLSRKKIPHNVLNAKQNQSEAEIVALAGQPGSVTIATNMAGRGTDIKLGEGIVSLTQEKYLEMPTKVSEDQPYGSPLDGLHVIGTERHESRRIDRQLRGRAGRQGDPGTSRFYLSLEDDLMRLFGSDRIAPMMMKFGFTEGEAITHPWMTNAVEKAQKRVEMHNFEIRKNLIKYDEVMTQQREVIYNYRRNVLKGYDLHHEILEMIADTLAFKVDEFYADIKYEEDWNPDKLIQWLAYNLNLQVSEKDLFTEQLSTEILLENALEIVNDAYKKREEKLGSEQLRDIERHSLLSVVDDEWRDHLHEMDLLQEAIGLRAYANKDPLIEYKKESFALFEGLISRIQENVTRKVFTLYIYTQEEIQSMLADAKASHASRTAFNESSGGQQSSNQEDAPKRKPRVVEEKVGRNEPCPCGSGKKYKKCCGKPTNE